MSDPAPLVPSSCLDRPARRRSPISLTPLIDVVFILLVFFMLASSFLDWRSIDLSGAVAGGSDGGKPILVEVGVTDLRYGSRSLSTAELISQLAGTQASGQAQRVLVRPNAGVSLQRTVDVLDALARGGISNLSLIRER